MSAASDNKGKINDSVRLDFLPVLKNYYEANDHAPLWSSVEKWKPQASLLLNYLSNAAEDGLYKEDYHFSAISSLKNSLDNDSVKRMDAVLWTKADLLFTDAFMHVIQDLKQGRLQPDSLAWKNNADKIQ